MEATLRQLKHFKFEFSSASGEKAILDGPASIGGGDEGLRPMEMVLGGLAGCSSFDILLILNKSRQTVTSFKVDIKAKRREEIPKIFTEIELNYLVGGEVEEKHLKRAIDLSIEKYCSVSKMLEQTVKIKTKYTLLKGVKE